MLRNSAELRSIRQRTVRWRMEGARSLLRRWVYCNPGLKTGTSLKKD